MNMGHSEPTPIARAVEQLYFLWLEMSAGRAGWRGVMCFISNWIRGGRLAVALYRSRRFWFLLLGRWHGISTLFMWPLYMWCRLIGGRHEIPAAANIGPGFRIIHPSLSCVVSRHVVAGVNLYMTGGNVLGARRRIADGEIRLGNDVMLGICSLVIGPITIGDQARIGAGATVVKDVAPGATVVSCAAQPLYTETEPIFI